MPPKLQGGGWHSLVYTLKMGRKVGFTKLWKAMKTRNACKTCALGMGGQKGGMRNELGHWPEVCKKSLQAMVSDMQGKISESFFRTYSIDQLRTLSPRELETAGRLTFPIYKGPQDTHYRPISWDEAMGMVAGKLRATAPERSFFYFSGRSSNEAGFLLQLMARAYGTNHVNNCSYYCHQASGVGLNRALGTGTATVSLDDVEHCDLFVLIGGNPASNHPRLMSSLMRLRRRGGHVVVINPVREPGLVKFGIPSDLRSLMSATKIASHYIQPKIGGDIPLLYGVMKCLLEDLASLDQNFLRLYTENWESFRDHLHQMTWDEILEKSGVRKESIRRLADIYRKSQNTIFGWTMGITHHRHGVENVEAIVNLALTRGMVGGKHRGLLPIRGHSNVQGIGSMGVVPELKPEIWQELQTMGIQPPSFTGYDTMACMDASHRGDMEFAFCLGGNLFGSNPDARYAAEAMSRIGTVVYLNTTLNTGHAWGSGRETLILPVRARDEENQPTTQESMFNYVRISEGGPSRHADLRSEVEIIAALASRVIPPMSTAIDWGALSRHDKIRELISRIIPAYRDVQKVDREKQEYELPNRVFHQPQFPTASGKARFHCHTLPDTAFDDGRYLKMMTIRSEGQFNTVVYEEEDQYRGQTHRNVILLHPDDIKKRNLRPNQRVQVKSATGTMDNILVRPFDISPGSAAMYYPEANVLVGRELDPLAKTPAFKSCLVEIFPSN